MTNPHKSGVQLAGRFQTMIGSKTARARRRYVITLKQLKARK